MTERLYYQDAYWQKFTAVVTDCTADKSIWRVTLDRTAFYPEGGGQPGDTGTLDSATVTDTREQNGEIIHFCDKPLTPGQTVAGAINWPRRFDLMQQHSGEHIVSGLICRHFRCDNVGFHLGKETVVIDFNRAISFEALSEIELAANQVIWENRPFSITHPAPGELETLNYRSKKELSGDVRIVECPGADICACCGTHVRSAGEIGLIKLLNAKPFRAGIRIEMLSGRRAYAYVSEAAAQNHQVSVLTSAKISGTATAVERLLSELDSVNYRLIGLENQIFRDKASQFTGAGNVLFFLDNAAPDALRRCADTVAETCGGCCAVFNESGAYAIADRAGHARETAKLVNETLNGRGGGKPGLVQGAVRAERSEIVTFFTGSPMFFRI